MERSIILGKKHHSWKEASSLKRIIFLREKHHPWREASFLERSIFFKKDHLSFIKEMIIKEAMGRS
ncbi:MAG: hypothetical protein MR706_00295 [Prevotella sp.]|nr:hypothetical protein [Prevotella sp.]